MGFCHLHPHPAELDVRSSPVNVLQVQVGLLINLITLSERVGLGFQLPELQPYEHPGRVA